MTVTAGRFGREELADVSRRRMMAWWERWETSSAGRWATENTRLLQILSDEESKAVPCAFAVLACLAVAAGAVGFAAAGARPWGLLGAVPVWALLVAAALWLAAFWDSYRDSDQRAADWLSTRPGLATRRQVAASMGTRHVMADVAPKVIPATLEKARRGELKGDDRPGPWSAAWLAGVCHGIRVWLDSERPVYVLGPTRSGKSTCVVMNAVVEAPGFVLATSTRSDIIRQTRLAREMGVRDQTTGASLGGRHAADHDRGVHVFDPEGIGDADPLTMHDMVWTPLMGCDDPTVAMRRAQTLVDIGGFGGGSQNREWGVSARDFIQALLYAAATGNRSIADCYRWSQSPEAAQEAADLIRERPGQRGMQPWAATIDALRHMDPRLRDNQWMGVKNAFAILADPSVRARMDYSPDDPRLIDPTDMIRRGDTVFILSKPKGDDGGANAGMFVALLLDTFLEAAQSLAFSPETGRRGKIEPPARFVLDELSNIEKWPQLRNAITQSGGNGIQLFVIEQSRAALADDYGEGVERTIWENCHLMMLPGVKDPDTLRWWVEQIGSHVRTRHERSWNPGQGPYAGVGERHEREEAVQASDLSRMPMGHAMVYALGGGSAPAFCRTVMFRDRGWWPSARLLESMRTARRTLDAHPSGRGRAGLERALAQAEAGRRSLDADGCARMTELLDGLARAVETEDGTKETKR